MCILWCSCLHLCYSVWQPLASQGSESSGRSAVAPCSASAGPSAAACSPSKPSLCTLKSSCTFSQSCGRQAHRGACSCSCASLPAPMLARLPATALLTARVRWQGALVKGASPQSLMPPCPRPHHQLPPPLTLTAADGTAATQTWLLHPALSGHRLRGGAVVRKRDDAAHGRASVASGVGWHSQLQLPRRPGVWAGPGSGGGRAGWARV